MLFMESLNNDDHKLLEYQFIVEVKNNFPEITSSPECILDQNGYCTFQLLLSDKDEADIAYAKLADSNNLTEGYANLVYQNEDEFHFTYQSDDTSRQVYTDVIKALSE